METGPVPPLSVTTAATLYANQHSERAESRELILAVRALNRAEVFGQHRELTFSLDRDTQRPVLRIIDRQTGEVITQLPPEHVLRLARHLSRP